jgi:hypothetical protein
VLIRPTRLACIVSAKNNVTYQEHAQWLYNNCLVEAIKHSQAHVLSEPRKQTLLNKHCVHREHHKRCSKTETMIVIIGLSPCVIRMGQGPANVDCEMLVWMGTCIWTIQCAFLLTPMTRAHQGPYLTTDTIAVLPGL